MLLGLTLALLAGFGCTKEAISTDQPGTDVGSYSSLDSITTPEAAAQYIQNATIYFPFDRFDLDSSAQATLNEKAILLKKFPTVHVKIEGHCDERGTEEYNLALGERRAKAAYDFLVMQGVQASQLTMISYGKLYPAVQGNDETAWSRNRRDEFKTSLH